MKKFYNIIYDKIHSCSQELDLHPAKKERFEDSNIFLLGYVSQRGKIGIFFDFFQKT